MKQKNLFVLGILAMTGVTQVAHAQRERQDRADTREQRQQQMQNMTPEQRQQYFQQRWQERYNNATPEVKARMDEQRAQMQQRMKDAGIDPNAPDAMQQAMQKGIFGGMGGGGNFGGRGGRGGGQMTPEQRDEARRALMTASDIKDKEIQDAVINFLNEREKARADLLTLARAAASALTVQAATPDDQQAAPAGQLAADAKPAAMDGDANAAKVVQTAAGDDGGIPDMAADKAKREAKVVDTYEAYEKALAEDRVSYAAGLKDLDTKVHYSTNPRIKAFLALTGVLEYDPLSFGGVAAIFNSNNNQQGGNRGPGGPGQGPDNGGQPPAPPAPPADGAAPPPAPPAG